MTNADRIFLNREYPAKQDAIRAIGEVMLAMGDVTPRYVQGMLEKEEQFSAWVTEGGALPHGSSQVKNEVRRNSVVVVQMPKGPDWGDGKTVCLAIGLAGKGDKQHLKLLAGLARVLQHRDTVERLKAATDQDEVVRILPGDRRPQ